MKETINTQFTAFKARCEAFFKEKLKPIGYTDYTCDDLTHKPLSATLRPFSTFVCQGLTQRQAETFGRCSWIIAPPTKSRQCSMKTLRALATYPQSMAI